MIRYNVRGENIEVTDAIREYVEKKVSKIEKYFDNVPEASAHVNLKTYSDKTAKVEVTIPLPNIVLRAEETTPDLYGSVDLVADKLERQIRKYKTKMNRRNRRSGLAEQEIPGGGLENNFLDGEDMEKFDEAGEANGTDIVRTKQLSLKPMDAEEAVLQMDMLGHSFFIYEDGETNNTNIVYKRNDGKYGLIETDGRATR